MLSRGAPDALRKSLIIHTFMIVFESLPRIMPANMQQHRTTEAGCGRELEMAALGASPLTDANGSGANLEARIARLEAESQIRQLVARYSFDIDDRRVEAVRSLFADDAVLRSADGVMNASGVDAIMRQFDGRFVVLGPGHHVMHDIQIDFESDTTARGRVSGHAELWRGGRMMVAALRYADRYRLTGRGWKFAERVISFLYYVPVESYPGILGRADRNHAYADPLPADYPETLPDWIAYERSQGRA